MTEKPISPLRRRMIEDMTICAASAPTRNATTSATSRSLRLFGPVSRHGDCGGLRTLPTAPDGDRRSAADHQRDGDGAAVLLQGHAGPPDLADAARVVREPRRLPRCSQPEEVATAAASAAPVQAQGGAQPAYGAGLRAIGGRRR